MWMHSYLPILLLNGILDYSNARLYRQAKFPIKDTASTTYYLEDNIVSKVQCASLCDKDFVNCKAFQFFPWTKSCQFINFQLPDPSRASMSDTIFGYVENGEHFSA